MSIVTVHIADEGDASEAQALDSPPPREDSSSHLADFDENDAHWSSEIDLKRIPNLKLTSRTVGDLLVIVHSGHGLSAKDFGGKSDPFVGVKLRSLDSNKTVTTTKHLRTPVIKVNVHVYQACGVGKYNHRCMYVCVYIQSTLDPTWTTQNQFWFKNIPLQAAEKLYCRLEAMDYDRGVRVRVCCIYVYVWVSPFLLSVHTHTQNDHLGVCVIPLAPVVDRQLIAKAVDLDERVGYHDRVTGHLNVSLGFRNIKESGSLTLDESAITASEASLLSPVDQRHMLNVTKNDTPATPVLVVYVHRAKDLQKRDVTGRSDPYGTVEPDIYV
jgi:hypothetical protein